MLHLFEKFCLNLGSWVLPFVIANPLFMLHCFLGFVFLQNTVNFVHG